MAPATDRRKIYVCFPFWTELAKKPQYLTYVVSRLIQTGWAPVIAPVYLLPAPTLTTAVIGDLIGGSMGTCDALMICFDDVHMTSYMTTEIVAAKRLKLHVLKLNVGTLKMKELQDGNNG